MSRLPILDWSCFSDKNLESGKKFQRIEPVPSHISFPSESIQNLLIEGLFKIPYRFLPSSIQYPFSTTCQFLVEFSTSFPGFLLVFLKFYSGLSTGKPPEFVRNRKKLGWEFKGTRKKLQGNPKIEIPPEILPISFRTPLQCLIDPSIVVAKILSQAQLLPIYNFRVPSQFIRRCYSQSFLALSNDYCLVSSKLLSRDF